MKITCNVVEDLLNAYADGALSDDSRAIVEDHLKTCTSCSNRLDTIREICAELDEEGALADADSDYGSLVRFRRWMSLRRVKYLAIGFAAALVLCIAAYQITYHHYTYVPYEKTGMTISDTGVISGLPDKAGFYQVYRGEDASGKEIAIFCMEANFAGKHWAHFEEEPMTDFASPEVGYNEAAGSYETYPPVDQLYYLAKSDYNDSESVVTDHIETLSGDASQQEQWKLLTALETRATLIWERNR